MATIRKGASMMERAERNAEQFRTITAKDVAFPYSAASADKLNADMYIACLGYADESHRAEMDEVAGSGIANAYAIFSNATEHFRTVYRAMMIDHAIRNNDGTMFPVDRFGFPDIADYLDGCFLRLTTPVEGTVNHRLGIPSWHGLIPESEGGTVICSAVVESDGTKYGLQPYGLMTEWDEFRVIANLCVAGYEQGIHHALRGIRNVLPELGYLPNPSGIQTLTRVLTSGGNPRNSAVTRSEKWEIVRQDNEENPNASTVTYTRENRGEKQVLTITNPDMTRFLMNLDESVELVKFAFEHGNPGDLFIQKAPASTIGDLAKAVQSLFGDTGTNIIGTRHGEKLYETLMTREERLRSEDMGDYFRIAADSRDLNYDKYFVKGQVLTQAEEAYTSHNAERLAVDGAIQRLLSTDYIQKQMRKAK